MATRTTAFCAGEHYHLYNRGNSKQRIFLNESDYIRFIQLLFLVNCSQSVSIRDVAKTHESIFSFERNDALVTLHAVCLMPNHFHILATPHMDSGLSQFMLKLGTGYSMYFNTKYERTGGLFEGRYKAKHIGDDRYFQYLFSYVHLNPLSLIEPERLHSQRDKYNFALSYPFSSLMLYDPDSARTAAPVPRAALGTGAAEMMDNLEKTVSTQFYRETHFPAGADVSREIFEWLTYRDELDLTLGQEQSH